MITANLATIPSRENVLEQVINSLLPQVDRINVFLNGHDKKPACLHDEKIFVEFGNNGYLDTAKFWWCDEIDGYHLICDDDTLYPDNFSEKCVKAVNELNAPVAYMGRSYPKGKINSYYKGASEYYNQFKDCKRLREVEILGTCATCFHTDIVDISIDNYFETLNSDIWFSAQCELQNVKRFVLPHTKNELKYLLNRNESTIFKRYRDSDKLQTKAFNEYFRGA